MGAHPGGPRRVLAESHRRAVAAIDEGKFEREIVPVEVSARRVPFAVDERRAATRRSEKLAALKPAFRRTACDRRKLEPIVDGAAAMLRRQRERRARSVSSLAARFVSFGLAGVDPYRMLHGNPQACEGAREGRADWDDMAVIEVNEAFASVVLQFLADTGLHERWEAGDVNPNGGGISLGHPLGATGRGSRRRS